RIPEKRRIGVAVAAILAVSVLIQEPKSRLEGITMPVGVRAGFADRRFDVDPAIPVGCAVFARRARALVDRLVVARFGLAVVDCALGRRQRLVVFPISFHGNPTRRSRLGTGQDPLRSTFGEENGALSLVQTPIFKVYGPNRRWAN